VPGNLRFTTAPGEDVLAPTRTHKAIFLTWGSDVESDERRFAENGKIKGRSWLAAPVHPLANIPAANTEIDPETNEKVSIQELIRRSKILHSFYLPAFPGTEPPVEYYADLKNITNIGAGFFMEARATRIVTLTMEALNELFTQLVWVFTRAELLFRPIRCECGRDVRVDVRFEGQNFDAEPL
jgi:hypothetical protein